MADARESGRFTTEDELRALLAERYAALADRASAAGDARGLMQAGDKLAELLDVLPLRARASGGGVSGDGGERARLLSIIDSPPTVGDAADA